MVFADFVSEMCSWGPLKIAQQFWSKSNNANFVRISGQNHRGIHVTLTLWDKVFPGCIFCRFYFRNVFQRSLKVCPAIFKQIGRRQFCPDFGPTSEGYPCNSDPVKQFFRVRFLPILLQKCVLEVHISLRSNFWANRTTPISSGFWAKNKGLSI